MTSEKSNPPVNKNIIPWSIEEFTHRLHKVGEVAYHDKHPFHILMNDGKLNRKQLQGWVANRFYYQTCIPIKDAAILSNCPEREVRRVWIKRIIDHDGTSEDEGGIKKWLRLGEAVGLISDEMLRFMHVLPGVRFAVDAYVNFARSKPWIEAVASSLTELFAPSLMEKRITSFERYYSWVDKEGLRYFDDRLSQASTDSNFALRLVTEWCQTLEQQELAVNALRFKCDMLWAMLDTIYLEYCIGK
jgi:pyrroloquinoline-quinone synthase